MVLCGCMGLHALVFSRKKKHYKQLQQNPKIIVGTQIKLQIAMFLKLREDTGSDANQSIIEIQTTLSREIHPNHLPKQAYKIHSLMTGALRWGTIALEICCKKKADKC